MLFVSLKPGRSYYPTVCMSLYELYAFAILTLQLHSILMFADAFSIPLLISSLAVNIRMTAWDLDETDLGVNELLTDTQ